MPAVPDATEPFTPPRAGAPEPVAPPPEDDPPLSLFVKAHSRPAARVWRRRVVRQHDEMDCGAACLATVAASYGRNVGLAAYRSMVHVTREGASMWSLLKAARATGFSAMGAQLQPAALEEIHLPAILLNQYHFVVLFRANSQWAWIGDPAIGMRKMPRAELQREWSGLALLLRPGEAFFAHPEAPSSFRKYLGLMRGNWRMLGEVLLASLLLLAFGLVGPLLTQVVFDRVLPDTNRGLLNIILVASVVLAIFQVVSSVVRVYLLGHLGNRFDAVFSALFYRHLLRLPLNFFMVRRVGDLLTRLGEIAKIRQFLTGETLNTLVQLAAVVIYLGVISLYSAKLGVVVLALTPVVAIVAAALSKRLKRTHEQDFLDNGRLQGLVAEQFRALETIKSLAAEIPARWRWEAALRRKLSTQLRLQRLRVAIGTGTTALEQLAATIVLWVASRAAVAGELTVGQVIATGQFAVAIFQPVRDLARRWSAMQETRVALGRADDVITCTGEPAEDFSAGTAEPAHQRGAPDGERLRGDIELREVWFQYGSDQSPWVIEGASLSIRAGETVALVGRSGCGKSTLVQLLNLLLSPTRGTVLIDGRPNTEIALATLRASIGIVMQDSQLFAGSILDNIAYGQPQPSLDLATQAARVANAHDFISNLPGGYMASLSEAGAGLSGGQRQRLNIARALYRRPSILVLDEATSALDAESEQDVVEGMKTFCRGRTSIIIAHRLSTILHADRVVLLDRGRVVEQGKHVDLIKARGPYAALFGAQLAQ